MKQYEIALIPGDGIGPEVILEAQKVTNLIAPKYNFKLNWHQFPFGANYYLKHKEVLPKGALEEIGSFEALLLGAVGDPRVKPGPIEQELLLKLRFHFDQYINLRPALSFPNVPLPIKTANNTQLDITVVRENTEDFYMGLGSVSDTKINETIETKRELYNLKGNINLELNKQDRLAYSLGIMTEKAVCRIAEYAFETALEKNVDTVHIATKANAIPALYGFWDEVCLKVGQEKYPHLNCKFVNVDALCYLLPREAEKYKVILCPNLFGDIISDLVSALVGGLGLASSANIGASLSMFEPVHGSAPDIAGSGKANPLATILSASLMLKHLKEFEAHKAMNKAVYEYLNSTSTNKNLLPIELGGKSTVSEVGTLVSKFI